MHPPDYLAAKQRGVCFRGKEEETYFDHLKKEIAERQAATRAEMDSMDVRTRESLEGFRPGAYIRMRITKAPCELVECFSPSNPLLVGGLSQGEEKVGYMHLRLKRHRWFPKLLKNRDPLVISAGWRRYQTLPIFSQEDNNGRHRMLKYTPEHMHCRATVYGPLVPPQTGIIAVQNLSGSLSTWRISATAVVMELDARFDIMKKLKLVGYPYKIERHTTYIKDMFTSEVCPILCAMLAAYPTSARTVLATSIVACAGVWSATCRWRYQSSSAHRFALFPVFGAR